MKKLINFYDAAREVEGTERKIRYKNRAWFRFGSMGFNDQRRVHLWRLTGQEPPNETKIWCPTFEEQKEKAWEVEPEEMNKENWPNKPEKCDCNALLNNKDLKVLTCVDTDNRPVYLERFCKCGQHFLVDTEGVMYRIVEY